MPDDPVTAFNLVKSLVELQGFSLYQIGGQYQIDFIDESQKNIIRVKISIKLLTTLTADKVRSNI